MSRSSVVAIAAVILSAAAGTAWALSARDRTPELSLGDSVAVDLAALTQGTFDEFTAAAPAVTHCLGSVRLEADIALDDPARYDPGSATITLRVPATAPSLRASLVHELAHHVEHVCSSHEGLRPAFLVAQGHAPDTAWFGATAWQDRPSEQFAEAVVVAVLARRSRNLLRLQLEPAATQLVADWLETPP